MSRSLERNIQHLHQLIEKQEAEEVEAFIKSLQSDAAKICSEEYSRHGTSLHVAAKSGNVDIIRIILETGLDVDIKQRDSFLVSGMVPLHGAVTYGNTDAVTYLLSQGADVNSAEGDGQTPLMMACQGSNIEIVRILLSNGAEINLNDSREQTALQISILRAPTEVSLLLIENGADTNILDDEGQSPLHYASEWGNVKLVKKLLEKGANVNLQDSGGNTPLHVGKGEEVQTLLIQNGADTTVRNLKAKPPIEGKIDTGTTEMQNINSALSKHMEKAAFRSVAVVQQNPAQQRVPKFAPKPSDMNLRELKTSLLGELQTKRSVQD